MKKEELKMLFSNEKFLSELREVNSMDTLKVFLGNHGVEMTYDEMNKAIRSEAELSEAELCSVSGGGIMSWISFAWKCFTWNMIECE